MEQQEARRTKGPNEKFCSDCGAIISIRATVCPVCKLGGSKGNLNKAGLLVITFFLGAIGAHKFYTGKIWQGVLYMLFFWTGIPGLIALIEFFIYAFTDTETLQERYPDCGSGAGVVVAVVAGFFVIISLVGILAAIAIPQFVQYRNRAYEASLKSELRALYTIEQDYFAGHSTYSASLEDLDYYPAINFITIEIISADSECFEAIGMHEEINKTLTIDCSGTIE